MPLRQPPSRSCFSLLESAIARSMRLSSWPRRRASIFAVFSVDAPLGRMACACLSIAERVRFRNGWKPKACKTFEASTKASRLPRLGGKTIPQMNRPASQSNHPSNAFFCVSLNPAIDTRLIVNGFVPGRVNRVSEVYRTPGGKAAHVRSEEHTSELQSLAYLV